MAATIEFGSNWHKVNLDSGEVMSGPLDEPLIINGKVPYALIPADSNSIEMIEVSASNDQTVLFVHSKKGAEPFEEIRDGSMKLGEISGSTEEGKTAEVTLAAITVAGSAWIEFNNPGSGSYAKIEVVKTE